MAINADKPHLWKADTRASVDQFNRWFIEFAPKAYRDTRKQTVSQVESGLALTKNLTEISPAVLRAQPSVLPTLRMATCPPLARDRLTGLANSNKSFVGSVERGIIPPRMSAESVSDHLARISQILLDMRDVDIFPWIAESRMPTRQERYRSATIVADRLCGSIADPIIRNAQEKRQLSLIGDYLAARNYRKIMHPAHVPITSMEPGTYAFRLNVPAKPSRTSAATVNIPVDVVIQPTKAALPRLPILIEAKSAGDFTNVNKRRKEEATKINQLKTTFGESVVFALFLCGYFDAAYLGYEAAEGIDWIWEHRIEDLNHLGI